MFSLFLCGVVTSLFPSLLCHLSPPFAPVPSPSASGEPVIPRLPLRAEIETCPPVSRPRSIHPSQSCLASSSPSPFPSASVSPRPVAGGRTQSIIISTSSETATQHTYRSRQNSGRQLQPTNQYTCISSIHGLYLEFRGQISYKNNGCLVSISSTKMPRSRRQDRT